MKKLFFLIVASLALFMTSCSSFSTREYEVTVVEKSDDFFSAFAVSALTYKVVTASGDTSEAVLRQDVVLNNKLPFKAVMKKGDAERYGYIDKVK